MTTLSSAVDLLVPTSVAEAVEAFGDGAGVTVLGGGTILTPEISQGRLAPGRTLLLTRAGMAGVSGDGTLTIGAMTPVAALADGTPEPLASAARNVGDPEIRAQATLGGNLCAPAGGLEAPRGDLAAPLVALAARVRSAGAGGERTEAVEDFLAAPEGRLVLAVEVDPPRAGAWVAQRRRHTHAYTLLGVAAAETADGVRIAAAHAGARAARLVSVEAALAGGAAPAEAAAAALDDVEPHDDALASAWYRARILPVLVARAIDQLRGA